MPSRFEPCGLGQMIAMRYGADPIVTRTGGLADTVRETPEPGKPQNGFVAQRCEAAEVQSPAERARSAFSHANEWERVARDAMSGDFTWERSVARYVELYRQVISRIG